MTLCLWWRRRCGIPFLTTAWRPPSSLQHQPFHFCYFIGLLLSWEYSHSPCLSLPPVIFIACFLPFGYWTHFPPWSPTFADCSQIYVLLADDRPDENQQPPARLAGLITSLLPPVKSAWRGDLSAETDPRQQFMSSHQLHPRAMTPILGLEYQGLKVETCLSKVCCTHARRREATHETKLSFSQLHL